MAKDQQSSRGGPPQLDLQRTLSATSAAESSKSERSSRLADGLGTTGGGGGGGSRRGSREEAIPSEGFGQVMGRLRQAANMDELPDPEPGTPDVFGSMRPSTGLGRKREWLFSLFSAAF